MTRQFRKSFDRRLNALSGEQLLLLTVFGGDDTRRFVDAELDRRATMRPKHIRATPRTEQRLRPAA